MIIGNEQGWIQRKCGRAVSPASGCVLHVQWDLRAHWHVSGAPPGSSTCVVSPMWGETTHQVVGLFACSYGVQGAEDCCCTSPPFPCCWRPKSSSPHPLSLGAALNERPTLTRLWTHRDPGTCWAPSRSSIDIPVSSDSPLTLRSKARGCGHTPFHCVVHGQWVLFTAYTPHY